MAATMTGLGKGGGGSGVKNRRWWWWGLGCKRAKVLGSDKYRSSFLQPEKSLAEPKLGQKMGLGSNF